MSLEHARAAGTPGSRITAAADALGYDHDGAGGRTPASAVAPRGVTRYEPADATRQRRRS